MFTPYLERWKLVPEGVAIVTQNARLLPVRYRGTAAMLKLAVEMEERRGV